MNKILTISFFTAILFLCGCATNPFKQFYINNVGVVDAAALPYVVLPLGDPAVSPGTDIKQDCDKMLEHNYTLLGFSSFNAAGASLEQLLEQAKSVNAAEVIFYEKYTSTVSGNIPLTLPDNQTSTTYESGSVNGSGSVYGNYGTNNYSGYGSYNGYSTTTTYGTKTTYIPYSIDRYDYLATFWIENKSPVFGINTANLSSELRKQIESNKGVVTLYVIEGSPAFNNDFLKGDILKRINDEEIIDKISFAKLIKKYAGQKVNISLIRDGKKLNKKVTLNSSY
jgi:hypothetical protein